MVEYLMECAIKNGTYVRVEGLNKSVSTEIIQVAFSRFGRILGVKKNTDKSILICFELPHSIQKACGISGACIGGCKIKVTPGTKDSSIDEPKKDSKNMENKPNKRIYKVCKYFLIGMCTKGSDCKYFHNTQTHGSNEESRNRRKFETCPHFISNKCKLGDKCPYMHSSKENISPASKNKKFPKKIKKSNSNEVSPASKSKQDNSSKSCGECNKNIINFHCSNCSLYFCHGCDKMVHSSKVMSRHSRIEISNQDKCKECRESVAVVKCIECDSVLCSKCSLNIHAFRVLRSHKREKIDSQNVQSSASEIKSNASKSVNEVSSESSSSESDDDTKTTPLNNSKSNNKNIHIQSERLNTSGQKNTPTKITFDVSSESSSEDDEEEVEVESETPKSNANSNINVLKKSKKIDDSEESGTSDESSENEEAESSSDSSDDDVGSKLSKKTPEPVLKNVLPSSDGISKMNSHSVVQKIEAYAKDKTNTESLELSPSLNSYERLLAHDCAERLGLNHVSVGSGLDRHIQISKPGESHANAAMKRERTNGSTPGKASKRKRTK